MSGTAFLGTSDFAARILERLAASTHRPSLVVTPPDRRRGRGRRPGSPPVADAARKAGIELIQAADVNGPDVAEALGAVDPEVVCLCAFGQIVREPLLSDHLVLNLHPSLLPRWRGAAPIERAIMAGDPETGACVMRVTEGLDSGPVADCERTQIGGEETFGELSARLADLGSTLLLRALDDSRSGLLRLTPQEESGATYAEKVEAAERRLDPARPADHLARVARALTPHIGAYLDLGEQGRLGVRRCRAEGGSAEAGSLRAADGALLLGCAEGVLRIREVQPPSSRWMDAAAYLRGHRPPARVADP